MAKEPTTPANPATPATPAASASTARKRRPRSTDRPVQAGDVASSLRRRDIETNTVSRATTGARTERAMALADVLANHSQAAGSGSGPGGTLADLQAMIASASPDDVKALRRLLFQPDAKTERGW